MRSRFYFSPAGSMVRFSEEVRPIVMDARDALCFPWAALAEDQHEDPKQPDEPQPLARPTQSSITEPEKTSTEDPLDDFLPSAPTQQDIKPWVTEHGVAMLLVLGNQARRKAAKLEARYEETVHGYHELQLRHTRAIERNAHLRHRLVAESWIPTALSLISGILIGGFWSADPKNALRWYMLFGGLLLGLIAIVVLIIRSVTAEKGSNDEQPEGKHRA